MKKLISAILFFLTTALCFGLENLSFFIEPRISLTWGELAEILYDTDDSIKSQLDWEQKPLFDIGLAAGINYKAFLLETVFDFSIPLGTSYMFDSDYEDGKKYSYTEHPIEKTVNLNAELSLSYEIKTTSIISVLPVLDLKYLYNSFDGGKGKGTRRGRNIKVNKVDYYRHSFFIFVGTGVDLHPFDKLAFYADFLIAPWCYQNSFDYHHGKNSPYPFSSIEIQNGFFTKYKFDLSADYTFAKNISLTAFTSFLFGFTDKGKFYSDAYSDDMVLFDNQQSGSNIYSARVGSAVKFTF